MTEQQIQKNSITMLEKEYKAYVVKVQVASRSGIHDTLQCIYGSFYSIEYKTPKSKTNISRLQMYNFIAVEEAGGHPFVSWSKEMTRQFVEDCLSAKIPNYLEYLLDKYDTDKQRLEIRELYNKVKRSS